MIQSLTFRFYNDNAAPYFGAYKTGSLSAGEPTLMFCMDAALRVISEEESKSDALKDIMLQTLTHEFCHAMQEFLGKEFDELEVEKILGAYNEKWNVFEAENADEKDPAVFSIPELLTALDGLQPDETSDDFVKGYEQVKDEVRSLFAPHVLWHEAEKKHVASKAIDNEKPTLP